ncbi:MAG: segregation/condensation protein A [Candidatus Aminicenantes bacterium]|nr:segregation/condensation protein A [Candidatus Aminicenantes bacterium]
METQKSYQVQLDVFQGPLDLLLFLIRKKKIDIHDIPIATITKEYLKYLNNKEKINLEREAEFLLIATLLIYIKSQMLLPREKVLEDDDDPRQILVNRLLDHQKIKAACHILREKEQNQLKIWQRTSYPPQVKTDEIELTEISLFNLTEAFFSLMKKKQKENIKILEGKKYSIEDKMKEIINILNENSFLDFSTYFTQQDSIEEALISFFSLLELIRAKLVIAVQESLFHPIKVWLLEEK